MESAEERLATSEAAFSHAVASVKKAVAHPQLAHTTRPVCVYFSFFVIVFFFSSDYLRLISSFGTHRFVWEPWKPGEGGKSGVSEPLVNELSSPPDAISQGDWRRVAGSIDSSSLQQEFNRSSCKSL